MSLQNVNVLVLGGAGFIGSRLVEQLVLEQRANVRVLVRRFGRAVRIARYPIEMLPGDAADPTALGQAMAGQQVVFDLTMVKEGGAKERQAAAARGAETIAQAALAAGVTRLVHVSTVSVYGRAADGDLDETAPRQRTGDPYGDSKLAAEEVMFDYHRRHNLPVVILQPTIVYGPFAGWTADPLTLLKAGRVVLVNNGEGLCNAVYVDDVTAALLLAARQPEVAGEAFLISGAEPVTWQEFYGAYETMLGFQSTVPMATAELAATERQLVRQNRATRQLFNRLRQDGDLRQLALRLPVIAQLYGFARWALPAPALSGLKDRLLGRAPGAVKPTVQPGKPLLLPSLTYRLLQEPKARVRIDKARQRLGYQPRCNLEEGMRLTERWAEWANLL